MVKKDFNIIGQSSLESGDHLLELPKNVLNMGGKIAIEWPKGCAYWKLEMVNKFVNKYELGTIHCSGCAMGLVSDEGLPIRKTWQIASNDKHLLEGFNGKYCPGKDKHP